MIIMHVPQMPPTANNAYFNMPGGGRALTSKGKKFLNEAVAHLTRHHQAERTQLKPNIALVSIYVAYFDAIETKGFATGKAEGRFVKLDASNRIKLVEDAVTKAYGGNDSANLFTGLFKRSAPEYKVEPCVDVLIWRIDDEPCDVLNRLELHADRARGRA